MKRSQSIRLVLLGLSAGTLAGCTEGKPRISEQAVYTNDYYVPGMGYYHAPFRNWFPYRYNYFDAKSQRYYYGGQWGSAPWLSVTNVSSPTAQTAVYVEANRTDISRGGFGGTGGYHYYGGHFYGGG